MDNRFIIIGDIHDGKGYLRMGVSMSHKDLQVGYQKVWGGGFWERDYAKRKLILYGESGAYGEPAIERIKRLDRDLTGYEIFYRSGSKEIQISLEGIEWI